MIALKDIKGVGEASLIKLKKLGVYTTFGLLSLLPTKYIDLKEPVSASETENGQTALLKGIVQKVSEASGRGKRGFYIDFKDTVGNGRAFRVFFYNQPYLKDAFSEGDEYVLLGKPTAEGRFLRLINPSYERADRVKNLDGIFTIYPLKGIIGQRSFKKLIGNALELAQNAEYKGASANINRELFSALKKSHLPKTLSEAEEGIKRLSEIDLAISLSVYKNARPKADKTRKVFYNKAKIRIVDFENALSFAPTESQAAAFFEIEKDLLSPLSMTRIINGDVGSGKTAVGFFAAYAAAASGYQTAFMAPTDVLCRQHAENFKPVAQRLGIKWAVLTSATEARERKAILNGLETGEISVIFGTQSLLGKYVKYKNLTLAVIDEQHRFGVRERAALEEKGACDVICMTATPIPRSLALTFYDDISISYIYKRPDAVTDVKTEISEGNAVEILKFIADAARRGEQSFVVCPTISDSEGFDVFSLETLIREHGRIFDGVKASVLHGRMSAEEKSEALNAFRSGESSVLFATTVIEVGIDTLARHIAILNADRFGLATLHQLRGRVGRDGSSGVCILHTNSASDKCVERLRRVSEISDGLELAELDFETRGAGELLGTRQSGAALTPIFALPFRSKALLSAKELSDELLSSLTPREIVALTRLSEKGCAALIDRLSSVTLSG